MIHDMTKYRHVLLRYCSYWYTIKYLEIQYHFDNIDPSERELGIYSPIVSYLLLSIRLVSSSKSYEYMTLYFLILKFIRNVSQDSQI